MSNGESMFEDLIGKNVKVKLGVLSGLTDSVKGQVILIENMWMKLQIKDKVELVNLDKVSRISILK
jgi:ribosome maturation factor RimP